MSRLEHEKVIDMAQRTYEELKLTVDEKVDFMIGFVRGWRDEEVRLCDLSHSSENEVISTGYKEARKICHKLKSSI